MTALLLAAALAVVVHEVGHAAAAQALSLPWRPTLTWRGPGMVIGSDSIRLTRLQIIATSAAGPLANLVLAGITYRLGLPFLVLANLEFAVVNLLPFPRSDGSRVLRGAA